jgi:hypothetical protein
MGLLVGRLSSWLAIMTLKALQIEHAAPSMVTNGNGLFAGQE